MLINFAGCYGSYGCNCCDCKLCSYWNVRASSENVSKPFCARNYCPHCYSRGMLCSYFNSLQ